MAVVAACIAYVQLTVTQCGITGIYAVLQYYVADFTCSCDYFAVFIYGEVVVCCVECAGAVYKERHDSVFCHSTYGQVVFGVQCIGLNIVYINVFVQLNLNLSAVMAYADVLVAAEVNIIAGFYVGCFGCNTVSRQIPTCISSVAYLLQLCYVYCVSIFSTCCYVSNLTSNGSTAYRYSTSVGFPSKAVFIFIRSIQANNMGFSISNRGGTNCNTAFTTSTCFLPNCNNTAFTTSHCSFANRNLCCIRCQIYSIFSHNRRYACTGHYTCSNQHCQQFFSRAAFSSMAFCHFGNNDICVARFIPNYFEYFVHKNTSHTNIIIYILYVTPVTCGNKLNSCFSNCPAIVLPRFQASAILQ